MRTFFPPTADAPPARKSLIRALLLSLLLVVVLVAINLMPAPDQGPIGSTSPIKRIESSPGLTASSSEDAELDLARSRTPQSQDTPTASARPSSPSLFGPGYILVLILLAAGGAGAFWLRKTTAGPNLGGQLKEIGRLRLNQAQQIQLIACAGEVLLVGTSPTGVTLLKAYPATEFAAPPQGTASRPVSAQHYEPPAQVASPEPPSRAETDLEEPEWSVASAAAINNGPDFLTVLRRYADRKTYRANTLYPPASSDTAN